VLYIAVDDLRPEMGPYGRAEMKTPRLDARAAKSPSCLIAPTCRSQRRTMRQEPQLVPGLLTQGVQGGPCCLLRLTVPTHFPAPRQCQR
jgi:hypothetical protein